MDLLKHDVDVWLAARMLLVSKKHIKGAQALNSETDVDTSSVLVFLNHTCRIFSPCRHVGFVSELVVHLVVQCSVTSLKRGILIDLNKILLMNPPAPGSGIPSTRSSLTLTSMAPERRLVSREQCLGESMVPVVLADVSLPDCSEGREFATKARILSDISR